REVGESVEKIAIEERVDGGAMTKRLAGAGQGDLLGLLGEVTKLGALSWGVGLGIPAALVAAFKGLGDEWNAQGRKRLCHARVLGESRRGHDERGEERETALEQGRGIGVQIAPAFEAIAFRDVHTTVNGLDARYVDIGRKIAHMV